MLSSHTVCVSNIALTSAYPPSILPPVIQDSAQYYPHLYPSCVFFLIMVRHSHCRQLLSVTARGDA